MSTQKSLKFAVTENDKRGASWNLWCQRDRHTELLNVYLLCREIGNAIKFSAHPTGQWQIAFSSDFFNKEAQKGIALDSRFLDKWVRPKEAKEGVTFAIRIITPPESVSVRLGKERGKIVQIDNAPKGKATEIRIFFLAPGIGVNKDDLNIIGELSLDDGERVVVVRKVVDLVLPVLPKKIGLEYFYFQGKTFQDLLGSNIRVIINGLDDSGVRILWDCSLGVSKVAILKVLWVRLKNRFKFS